MNRGDDKNEKIKSKKYIDYGISLNGSNLHSSSSKC